MLINGEIVEYSEVNRAFATSIANRLGKRVVDSGIFSYRTLRIE